jgi:toxin ParE1/3/4
MRIRFTNEAREDLLAIEEYLFEHAGETIARRVIERILARCHQLERLPSLGRSRPEIWPDARALLADPWLIIYRLTEDAVEISRVVHQARDLKAL